MPMGINTIFQSGGTNAFIAARNKRNYIGYAKTVRRRIKTYS